MPLHQSGIITSRKQTIAEATYRREDSSWRSLGGAGRINDLNPATRDRAQRLAVQMAMKNMLAKRLIKLRINYVLGAGVSIVSPRPEIAVAVQRWWNDQYNNWPKNLAPRLWDLYVKGEWLHLPVQDSKGFIRIRDVVTDAIEDVVMDPWDHSKIEAIIVRDIKNNVYGYDKLELKTIRKRIDHATGDLEASYTGDVFYHAINSSATQTRGQSELVSLLDYLEGLDKALYARIDLIRALSSVYFDLQVEGMSEEQMRKYVMDHRDLPPRPGTVWAHSPTMKMSPMTPDLKSGDMEKELRLFQSLIIGSDGWPGMLFDDPGSAGRAVGAEMVDSAMRNITSLQAEIDNFLSEEIDFYLESLGLRSRSRSTGERLYRLVWARPSIREIQRFAPALERIQDTLSKAEKDRTLTQEEHRSILVQQLAQLGMTDIPLQLELPAELIVQTQPVTGDIRDGKPRALPNPNPNQNRAQA